MRLSKRAAMVALTAVMALSILTACGGGNTPSGGNGGTNTGTGTGTGTGSGSGTEEDGSGTGGNGTGKDDGTADPSVHANRMEKYFALQGVVGKKRYIQFLNEEDGLVYTQAYDGTRGVDCTYYATSSDNYAEPHPQRYLYDFKNQCYYRIDEWRKVVERYDGKVGEWRVNTVNYVPTDLTEAKESVPGTYVVHGTEYYSERIGISLYRYCFAQNDTQGTKLLYIINKGFWGNEEKILAVRAISGQFDINLLRVPEGYKYYIAGENNSLNYQGLTGKDMYTN